MRVCVCVCVCTMHTYACLSSCLLYVLAQHAMEIEAVHKRIWNTVEWGGSRLKSPPLATADHAMMLPDVAVSIAHFTAVALCKLATLYRPCIVLCIYSFTKRTF